jgi:hypothetical protein
VKTKTGILSGVLAIGLLGGLMWLAHAPSEPRHQGRPLSVWFKQFYRAGDFSRRPDAVQRAEAAAAFQALGTNAVPFLLEECFAARPQRGRITNLFAFLGSLPPAFQLPPYMPGEYISHEAAEAMGVIRPPASCLLPRLTNALTSTRSRQRYMALYLAGYAGEGGEAMVPFLQQPLRSEDSLARGLSLQSAQRLGIRGAALTPDLVELLRRPDLPPGVRRQVYRVLGGLGESAAQAAASLREELKVATDPKTRFVLVLTLCRIQPAEGGYLEAELADALAEGESPRWAELARQLGWHGSHAPPAIPFLWRVADGAQFDNWWAAIGALHHLGESQPRLMSNLVGRLQTTDPAARYNVASYLLDLDPDHAAARAALQQLVASDSHWRWSAQERLRKAAAQAAAVKRKQHTNPAPGTVLR